jgi:hypothetical protein
MSRPQSRRDHETGGDALAMARAREQKTKPTSPDVEAFLDAIPDETRRADARQLCKLMAEVTGEPPVLWGSSIVGFGSYDYRYESGHEGTSALAGFAPRKQHLVVYLVGGFEDRHDKLIANLARTRPAKAASTSSGSPMSISTCYGSSSTVPCGSAVASIGPPIASPDRRSGKSRRHSVVGAPVLGPFGVVTGVVVPASDPVNGRSAMSWACDARALTFSPASSARCLA